MFVRRLLFISACLLIGCESKQLPKTQTAQKTKKPLVTLDGNVAIDFSPDGKWLAIGAELIDTDTWKIVSKLDERISDKHPKSKNHWGYTSVAFSPDSKKLALGDQDGSLRILDVPSMELKQELIAHGARLTGIGFANDNETIVSTSVDDSIRIRIWNSGNGKELFRSDSFDKKPKDEGGIVVDVVHGVDVFALSPNRELYAAADVMSKIVIGSVRDGKILKEFKGPNGDKVEMDSLTFSPDSSKLYVGVTPKIYEYDLDGNPTNVSIDTTADSSAMRLKILSEGGLIAMNYVDSVSKMPVIEFYDAMQKRSLGTFFPHQARGDYWAVSPNGQYMATVERGGPVQIWNVKESMQDLKSPSSR
jgi:WD40 repeat protein